VGARTRQEEDSQADSIKRVSKSKKVAGEDRPTHALAHNLKPCVVNREAPVIQINTVCGAGWSTKQSSLAYDTIAIASTVEMELDRAALTYRYSLLPLVAWF
jgi:hypothetical protein